jgi:hypothetical protein
VQLDANGAPAFTAPDGQALPPEPPGEMVDDAVAFLRERAADRELELGAETNLPEWDRHVVDYDWAVGAMIRMSASNSLRRAWARQAARVRLPVLVTWL